MASKQELDDLDQAAVNTQRPAHSGHAKSSLPGVGPQASDLRPVRARPCADPIPHRERTRRPDPAWCGSPLAGCPPAHRTSRSGATSATRTVSISPRRSAGVRAFSPTSHITQRDGGIGMRRAAAPSCAPATQTAQDCSTATFQGRPSWMIPGWRPSPVPGSPEVSMHPADIPAVREPIHEPRRHPGIPAGVLAHPLRRDPRPASPPRATGPSAAGPTDGMPAPRQSGRPCRRHERALSVRDSMYKYSDRAAAC